eukprot:Filipodium_phascolosomae@DN258_c0_g1_i2.p1
MGLRGRTTDFNMQLGGGASTIIRNDLGGKKPVSVSGYRKQRVNIIARRLGGYMLKESKTLSGFEKRFFQVEVEEDPLAVFLTYYLDKDDWKSRLESGSKVLKNDEKRGRIPLSDVIQIQKHAKFEKQFMIIRSDETTRTKTKTFTLKAKDYQHRDSWVKGLQDLLKELQPQVEDSLHPSG